MQSVRSLVLFSFALACGGGSGDYPNAKCGDFDAAHCVRIPSGDAAALLETVNDLQPDTVVLLGVGTYELDNQITIRADGIHLVGQGMDQTILSFGAVTTQINGVDAQGDDFLIQDLTVLDAPKDGIRVENSVGVTFRRIKATLVSRSRPGQRRLRHLSGPLRERARGGLHRGACL